MNKRLKIYLAGAMMNCASFEEMNDWRRKMKKLLYDYAKYFPLDPTVINPVDFFNFKDNRHQNNREVMNYDLTHVKSSDIIIVQLKGLNTSCGSWIELYEAYKNNIPVLALGTNEEYNNLHPWLKEYITRVDDSDDTIAKYIRDFYFVC